MHACTVIITCIAHITFRTQWCDLMQLPSDKSKALHINTTVTFLRFVFSRNTRSSPCCGARSIIKKTLVHISGPHWKRQTSLHIWLNDKNASGVKWHLLRHSWHEICWQELSFDSLERKKNCTGKIIISKFCISVNVLIYNLQLIGNTQNRRYFKEHLYGGFTECCIRIIQ